MEKNTHYVYSDELYHYGRKGMKWGEHIFGKPRSGSKGKVVAKKKPTDATPEAKKKSLSEKIAESKKAKAEAAAKAAEEARKRDPKNMTDEEIRKAIDRKKLENEYYQYHPQKVSRGKKFVKDFIDKALLPAMIESGKKLAGNAFDKISKELLEKNAPPPSTKEKLQKKNDLLKLQKDNLQMEKAIQDLKDTPYQDLIRKAAEAKLNQTITGKDSGKKKDKDEDE